MGATTKVYVQTGGYAWVESERSAVVPPFIHGFAFYGFSNLWSTGV